MTRKEALELLHKHMKNENLRRHCYAVEASMKKLYDRLTPKEKQSDKERERWAIAGLLHDADYELLKEDAEKAKKEHTKHTIKWLEELDAHSDVANAIATHAWGYVENAPKPKTKMQWALYACDELTGLIVAVALVKPEKKLSSVSVDSVMKKWNQKAFAAGVDREQISMCEGKLGIPLRDFVGTTLSAMQEIHADLGL